MEIASLWAAIGARMKRGEWKQADDQMARTKEALHKLGGAFAGAFADKNGRWRAANGRFLTMAELAQAAGAGVTGLGGAAERAAKRGAGATAQLAKSWGLVRTMAAGALAYVGLGAAKRALVDVNASAEESKNQIAGMLALTKKTDLAEQLKPAETLMTNLSKRAATLPGETSDYIGMLTNIVQPVTQAGLGMKDLEELTVGAVVAAKALREDAGAAARDIGQALRGQAGADDPFIGKLLDTAGFTGQEGRKRFNAKSAGERARIVKDLITSKQIMQLADAQGKTFNGTLATLKDSLTQFLARVGLPLFRALAGAIAAANAWIDAHKAALDEVAAVVGGALVAAFGTFSTVLKSVFGFLAEHGEFTKSLLIAIGVVFAALAVKAAIAWAVAFAPVVAIVAGITAIVYAIRLLLKHPDKVRAAFRGMWESIKNATSAVWTSIKAFGERIRTFFAEDIPNAIKAAFKAAFEWVRSLPVVKEIFDAIARFTPTDEVKRNQMPAVRIRPLGAPDTPSLPAGAGGPVSSAVNVNVGGISVASSSADPQAVATEVGRVFDERMAGLLRQTMDIVG